MTHIRKQLKRPTIIIVFLSLLISFGCAETSGTPEAWKPANTWLTQTPAAGAPAADSAPVQNLDFLPPTRVPGTPILTPTPSLPRVLPTLRAETDQYTVQPGDSLNLIARKYNADLRSIIKANELNNPDLLEVGQLLTIPPSVPSETGPSFKIIPDSELVNSPVAATLNIANFIEQQGGYLSQYKEDVDGLSTSGADIVARISLEYSVNPRILLAALEYSSGWVTRSDIKEPANTYPMGQQDAYRQGLYRQLAWAANTLNRGYYLWQINALGGWILSDSNIILIDPTINAGTAAVQFLMSTQYDLASWKIAVGSQGLFKTYQNLFGYPFDLAVDPLVPNGLRQPEMRLPFEKNQVWSFTGGPHGGWGDGSAWAAIDFAPPGNTLGCVQNDAWVTAAAPGLVVYANNGIVLIDLDQDGFYQTGWILFYLHIESRDRIAVGTNVQAGDPIGHASCEGGVSNGTHVHFARRYNGEWIAADGPMPFILDGWVSEGTGNEYDGFLRKNGQFVEAWDSRKAENQIQR